MNPLVSLIVPCWNGEKYLDSFLSCIISQSYRPLELIFIDDGSTDSTMSILDSRKADIEKAGISLISESIPHQGQAAAMNAGLRHVKGEYLTWSDSDDFLLSDAVKAKADFLTENKAYGMVRNDAWKYVEKTNILSKRMNNTYDENIFDSIFRETLYCYAGCYMVRMELFNECYPERTIPYSKEGQNLQMLLPPASRTRCGYIDKALMIYRIHSDSHAHKHRDLKEVVERTKGFIVLKKEILNYCTTDRDYYEKEADQMLHDLKQNLFTNARAAQRTNR